MPKKLDGSAGTELVQVNMKIQETIISRSEGTNNKKEWGRERGANWGRGRQERMMHGRQRFLEAFHKKEMGE